MITLDFETYPSQTFEANLDGKNYFFKITWNSRGEFWSLSISDEAKTLVVAGIKICLNYGILQDYRHLPVPPGEMFFFDATGDGEKIQYEDFQNSRALQFVYLTEAELASI